MLLALSFKGPNRGIDRMLGQETIRALMIENRMATAKIRQEFANAIFEFLNIHVEQRRRSLIKPPGPLAIVDSANVEVMLNYVALDGTQDLAALFRR